MSNEMIKNLNQVEGFNPEDYARVISDNGENSRKYLDVAWRKVWFYLKYPNGRITKKIVQTTNQFVIIEARVYFDRSDADENYISSAMAQRWFNKGDVFGERAVETAETGAVGRALADAGFGLQYCCDANGEGEQDIVDAPIGVPAKPQGSTAAASKAEPPPKAAAPAETKTPENTAAASATKIETPPANSDKLSAPVGLLVNTAKPAEKNESKKPEITEENSTDFQEIKTGEPENNEDARQPEEPAKQGYDNSMEVSEIAKIMTFDEAYEFVVDVGFNKGKTLGEIAHHKPETLNWYIKSYTGPNNILRAGAKILADYVVELQQKQKAS